MVKSVANTAALVVWTVVLLGLASAAGSEVADADRCKARLELTLTPDVPDPRDPSFLSALTSSLEYQLKWIRGSATAAIVELTGPAGDYHCEDGIERISRDARVLDVKVLQPDSKQSTASGVSQRSL